MARLLTNPNPSPDPYPNPSPNSDPNPSPNSDPNPNPNRNPNPNQARLLACGADLHALTHAGETSASDGSTVSSSSR